MKSNNCIKTYLQKLGPEWDNKNHIAGLVTYFKDDHRRLCEEMGVKGVTDSTVFYRWLAYWIVGAVARVMETNQRNKMLILDGPQGCGKSHFIHWLGSILPENFIEAPLDPPIQEAKRALVSNLVWEVSDLEAFLRQRGGQKALREFIKTTTVIVRARYQKGATPQPATASLISTINSGPAPLLNATGHTDFLICRLASIDWAYAEAIDPQQVWAQAVAMYEHSVSRHPYNKEAIVQYSINQDYIVDADPMPAPAFYYWPEAAEV